VEVLAVIAIIGILAALLTPAVSGMLAKARRTRVLNNMRQIALAYGSYVSDGRSMQELHRSSNANSWAATLARRTAVNDAAIYIIPEDYLTSGTAGPVPQLIVPPNGAQTTPTEAFKIFPLGMTIITGISAHANPSTTPLAYTRGLDPETGAWKPATGPDGGVDGPEGGCVVFLDGHAIHAPSLDGVLIRYEDGAPTADIRQAVNPGSRAINWQGTVWSN
jgi:type II secretory pathway pseudopilin PulG